MLRKQLETDRPYYVKDTGLYGYTTDGVGMHWFDTREEIEFEVMFHEGIITIDTLSEWE